MSQESFDTHSAHEILHVKLDLQRELIKLFTREENPQNEKALAWVEIYSEPFRILYQEKISQDPEFFLSYESKKEEILSYFATELRRLGLER